MVVVKIIVVALVFMAVTNVFAWSMRSEYEPVPGKTIKRTVLKFWGDGVQSEYRSVNAPYLMSARKQLKLQSRQNVFITVWGLGAQSVMYRVFNPSIKREKPICELWSASDKFKHRIKEGKLQIKVLKSSKPKPMWKWESCS